MNQKLEIYFLADQSRGNRQNEKYHKKVSECADKRKAVAKREE